MADRNIDFRAVDRGGTIPIDRRQEMFVDERVDPQRLLRLSQIEKVP